MLRLLQADPPRDAREAARALATTELRRGAALRRCGAVTAARCAIERAITIADEMPDVQVQAYLVLVALLVQLGRLPLARDAADRAQCIADRVGEVKLQGWAWLEKGEVLAACGRYADARQAFLQAGRRVREAGDHVHAVKVQGNLGHCLAELGRLGQARRRYLKAIALARHHGVPASEALWLVELGRLALREGRAEEADDCAAGALRIAKPGRDLLTCFRAEWLRHLARRHLRPDEPDRHRVAYLRKLYLRLEEHDGVEEIRRFKREYCSAPEDGRAS
jgi:tetratricopeptide (TPR) repeat protein